MKNHKNTNTRDSFNKMFPLALILLLVPMIVFLKELVITEVPADLITPETKFDFFSYYKSIWLVILSCSSILFISYYIYVKKFKFKLSFGFIPLFIYYIFVFLSTSFSSYHEVSFNGYPNRSEGFWVMTCYAIICFIAAHFITYEKDIKLLFGALFICATLLCILGISQFLSYDFLQLSTIKKLMLPSTHEHLIETLEFKFPEKIIYLTLFNPNYVGSFCALVLPICIVALFYSKKILIKIFSAVVSVMLLANLIGSHSSAGYISILFSMLLLIILLRKMILKYWVPILGLIICGIAALVYLNYNYSGLILNEIRDFLPQKQGPIVYKSGAYRSITDMTIDRNVMTIYLDKASINVKYDLRDTKISFSDETGIAVNAIQSSDDNNLLTFDNPKYSGLRVKLSGAVFTIYSANVKYYVGLDATGSFKFLNHTGKPTDIINAESYGFEGYEKWASNRGYIWSRSIPLIKDTILLGHGPDTYPIYFPQNDFKGKLQAFSTPYMIVDKPHSMYLQMAINTGVVSLIAFLVFVLWYICSSLKLYLKPKKNDSFYFMAGSACVASVVGFLVTGLANDSNVNVSPIFWILLGIGFACNRLYAKEINVLTTPSNKSSNAQSKSTLKASKTTE